MVINDDSALLLPSKHPGWVAEVDKVWKKWRDLQSKLVEFTLSLFFNNINENLNSI